MIEEEKKEEEKREDKEKNTPDGRKHIDHREV